MILYNTADPSQTVSFEQAVFQGLAPKGGLFIPLSFPILRRSFFEELPGMSLEDLSFEVCEALIGDEIGEKALQKICSEAFDFPVPLKELEPGISVLELFHGPSLAFKDFGARFMARVMAHFNASRQQPLHILVATSGDTGGAVAMGFHGVPGIKVTILYPQGRVSDYQEIQLTTLGDNVQALEVEGSFDDCQAMVKSAFSDRELTTRLGLTSANSINIARLIPQMLYYFKAWGDLKSDSPAVFSVPSGNFGNICAAAFARKMGLPVKKLVASVNENRIFTDYLASGTFTPKASVSTLSNAMDVGNPSNFIRIKALLPELTEMRECFASYSFSDVETAQAMESLWEKYGYVSEPHAAVGYLGLEKYKAETADASPGIFLATAHPSKFLPSLPQAVRERVLIPDSLISLLQRERIKTCIPARYEALFDVLKSNG